MGESDWFTNLVDRQYHADLMDLEISDCAEDTKPASGNSCSENCSHHPERVSIDFQDLLVHLQYL